MYNADGSVTIVKEHFGGSAYPLSDLGFCSDSYIYAGFVAIIVNVVVCIVATLILRAVKAPVGTDATQDTEYFADRDDPRIHDLPPVETST